MNATITAATGLTIDHAAETAAETAAAATTVYIGLGANLGERGQALRFAVQTLARLPGTRLRGVSSLYRSAPVDASGPDYLNAVAVLETNAAPQDFLAQLQALENAAGRQRPYRNAPRTLDLDILLWGDARLDIPTLTVPHPRMKERAFVLRPLAELAPQRVTAAQLAAVARQAIDVLTGPQWVEDNAIL